MSENPDMLMFQSEDPSLYFPQDDTRSYSRAKHSILRLRGQSRNPLNVSSEPKQRMARFIQNVESPNRSNTCSSCSDAPAEERSKDLPANQTRRWHRA